MRCNARLRSAASLVIEFNQIGTQGPIVVTSLKYRRFLLDDRYDFLTSHLTELPTSLAAIRNSLFPSVLVFG